MNGFMNWLRGAVTSAIPRSSSQRRSRNGRSPSRKSVRPAIEALEDRNLMSVSLNWVNEGDIYGRKDTDNFDTVFLGNAPRARQVIHTAMQEWQNAIDDLNRKDPNFSALSPNAAMHNAINLTISMDVSFLKTNIGGLNTHIDTYDANGVPVAATIFINPFTQTNPINGWFLDPNLWSSAFLGTPTNAFAGYAQAGSKAFGQGDLLNGVTHEIGHAVGYYSTRSDNGAKSPLTAHSIDAGTVPNSKNYVDKSSGDGGTHGKGDYWLVLGPNGFSALLTGFDTGGTGGGVDSHGGGHFAASDATWTNPTTTIPYFGADDLMNAYGKVGQRRIVSHEDALVLQYTYGYTVHDPAASGTFYSVLDETGTLTLRGRQNASVGDGLQLGNTISGASKSVDTYVQLGSQEAGAGTLTLYTHSFSLQSIKAIVIQTGSALATVNITGLFAQTPTTIINAGPAVVQINGDTVNGVISILNSPFANTDLIMDNSFSWAARTVTVSQDATYTTISGMTNSTVTYRNANAGNVTLKTGGLTEHVFIQGVAAQSLSVITNSNPKVTTDPTTYVTIGSGGRLTNISAPIYFWAASGKINLTVDDSADPNHPQPLHGQVVLPALGLRPAGTYETIEKLSPTIYYRVQDLAGPVQTKTGPGIAGFTIANAIAPFQLTLNSNNTTVYVGGGSLNNILANITILATAGNHVNLVIDDSQTATNRTLTLSRNAGIDLVTLQGGGTISFAENALNSLTIYASSGVSTINVNDTAPNIVTTIDRPVRNTGATSVNVYGTTGALTLGLFGVNDFITIGSHAATLDTIQGPVTISGGNALSTVGVYVNDSGSASQQIYTLTATGLSRPGAAPITITTYVSNLSLNLRADEVDVQGTPGITNLIEVKDVYTVNVGTLDNVLSNIGTLVVNGSALINLNDQGATGPETYTFGRSIKNYFTATGTTVNYNSTSVNQQVVLNAGDQGNTINIRATTAGNLTTINAGAGANTILVGYKGKFDTDSTLDNVQGPVTINGSGADTLILNDQGTTADRTFILDNGSVSWAGGSVSSTGVANLILNAGAGQNLFGVQGTLAGTTTTLNGGAGYNEFVVQDVNLTMDSLQGALALHGNTGPSGVSFAVLYDFYNPVGQTFTFTAGLVTRTGIAPITYDGLGEIILGASYAGGNTVYVQSNAAEVYLALEVGVGDTVYLGKPLNDGSGTATLADIFGSVGLADFAAPTVVVDNSADTSAHNVTTGQDPYGVYLDGLAPGRLYFNVNPAAQVQVKSGGDVNGLDAFFALLGQGALN